MAPEQASVCNHVKISQWMSDLSFFPPFFLEVLRDGLQRGVVALPKTIFILLKPSRVEVRINADQNVSDSP